MKTSEYHTPLSFIDLAIQQKSIKDKIDSAISKVLNHGQYIMGPEVKEFENALRNFTGAKHVISCANGTDALSLVLMAWNIGKNDAVFVPSFTYVASAEAPAQLGATPFFVDVCSDSFNIDPESFILAISEAKSMGFNPKVVVVVDFRVTRQALREGMPRRGRTRGTAARSRAPQSLYLPFLVLAVHF